MFNHQTRQEQLRQEIKKCCLLGLHHYVISSGEKKIEELITKHDDDVVLLDGLNLIPKAFGRCQRLSVSETWSDDTARFFDRLEGFGLFEKVKLLRKWEANESRVAESRHLFRQYQTVFRKLAPLIARRGLSPTLKSMWVEFLQQSNCYRDDLVCTLSDAKLSEEQWKPALCLLERVVYDSAHPPPKRLLATIAAFAKHAPSIETAIKLTDEVVRSQNDKYLVDSDIEAAFTLTDDATMGGRLLQALGGYDMSQVAKRIIRCGIDCSLKSAVCRLVLSGKLKVLKQIACLSEIAYAVDKTAPSLPDLEFETDWMNRYPDELHPSLMMLARQTSQAPQICEKLLAQNFPSQQRIETERASLIQKLKTVLFDPRKRRGMEARIRSLEGRLTSPDRITDQRLHNLSEKILDRAAHETAHRFLLLCREQITRNIGLMSGHEPFPERLFDPPHDQLVVAILGLDGHAKTIGLRLLARADAEKKNAEPLEPENESFLQSLASVGIDVQPWLAANQSRTVQAADGSEVEMAFATDSLDVLLMGFHFDTCLAPDGCNFFSVIANAIDVNKQVLYCRDKNGKVLGRCLFGLTSRGQIQTFHRYCHKPEIGFDDLVDQYAKNLARCMGTTLTSHGQIKRLIAKQWYDDGAVAGGLAFLEKSENENPLVRTLRTSSPERVIDELEELFGSFAAVQSNLRWVLSDQAINGRRELVTRLVQAFGHEKQTSFADRIRLAILARRFKCPKIAADVLKQYDANSLARRLKALEVGEDQWRHCVGSEREVLDLLVEYSPRITRRYLIMTRPKNVTHERQESAVRRRALVKIHQLAGRHERARRLKQKGCGKP